MKVVSDASPIANLAAIGRLNLLRKQFGSLLIPDAVAAELGAFSNTVASDAIRTALTDGWIAVQSVTVTARPLVDLLSRELDPGEAEAIALAQDSSADLVLIDEADGRDVATRLGLAVRGVLGVLLTGKRDGALERLAPEIFRLRKDAHFFIAAPLEAKLLAAAGESGGT